MDNPSTDATLNGWLLTPASNLVEFLANETVICGLTQRVLYASALVPGLIALAEGQAVQVDPKIAGTFKRIFEGSQTDAAFAKEEIQNGFATILSHHAVGMWAAIESAIEHCLLGLIRRVPNSHDLILGSAPNLNGERFRTKTANDAHKALSIWNGEFKKHSFEKALEMLHVFSVILNISGQKTQTLIELSEIRNVLLHQGGFADERLLSKCPWMNLKLGQRVKVTRERMDEYIEAAHAFAVELAGAIVRSPHMVIVPKG